MPYFIRVGLGAQTSPKTRRLDSSPGASLLERSGKFGLQRGTSDGCLLCTLWRSRAFESQESCQSRKIRVSTEAVSIRRWIHLASLAVTVSRNPGSCFPFSAGLELALRHMHPGQRCIVRCETRFAFGPDGCPATQPGDVDLPPNADIELVVELVEVVSSTAPANMTPVEKLAEYHRRKTVGNEHFARRAFKKAIRSYTWVLQALSEEDFPTDSGMGSEARCLQIDCGNNAAMTFMRMGDLERAKEAAVGVLVLDPLNTKALFRAGQVSSLQGNFSEANLALRKALDVEPNSKEVQAELSRLSRRIKTYRKKNEALQRKMGQNLFSNGDGRRSGSLREEANALAQASSEGAQGSEQNPNVSLPEREDGCAPVPMTPEQESTHFTFARYQVLLAYVIVPLVAWSIMQAFFTR